MEHVLTHLNLYCGNILGEQSKATNEGKKSKRKSINSNILHTNIIVADESSQSIDQPILKNEDLSKIDKNEGLIIKTGNGDVFNTENERYTDDGFKIRSEILSDDSDISDAFDSDCDDLESTLDNAEKEEEVDDFLTTKEKRNEKLKKLKKPLLQLISDFGMEEELFSNKKRKSGMLRDPSSQNLNIIDYSLKRGKRKTENLNSAPNEAKSKNAEEKEKFKKARYDIFKFGITGFETGEKKNLKIALAIKLGAKPPKKVAKNYKTIIEEKMNEKKLEKERLERKDDPLNKIKAKAIAKKKERASLHGITTGKFQGGVLKLTNKDIKKIQSSR